jgi:hypothetical protein
MVTVIGIRRSTAARIASFACLFVNSWSVDILGLASVHCAKSGNVRFMVGILRDRLE